MRGMYIIIEYDPDDRTAVPYLEEFCWAKIFSTCKEATDFVADGIDGPFKIVELVKAE